MVNRFVLNAISYHGKGAIKEIPGLVAAKGYKKAFIASDPDLVKFNVTKKVTDLLDEAGMAYEIYSDIKPNPTIENVQSGVEAYKKSGADYMITIGGGSSMDTAKAIGIIINNPEFADRRHGRRGHHQLRHHRRGAQAQVRLRGHQRHPRHRHRGPRHDGLHAQGPHRLHRHGRPDPRH